MKEESATDEEERNRKRAEWAESRRRRRLLRCGDARDLGETEVSAAKIWRRRRRRSRRRFRKIRARRVALAPRHQRVRCCSGSERAKVLLFQKSAGPTMNCLKSDRAPRFSRNASIVQADMI